MQRLSRTGMAMLVSTLLLALTVAAFRAGSSQTAALNHRPPPTPTPTRTPSPTPPPHLAPGR